MMSPYADIMPLLVFGLFVSAAIVSGLLMVRHEAGAGGDIQERTLDLCFWMLMAAIFGGRLLTLLRQPSVFLYDPMSFFRFWDGAVFYSDGLAAAIGAAAVFIRLRRMPLWKTADQFAPSLAIGHFFVWIGCFFSGLCPESRAGLSASIVFARPQEGLAGLLPFPHPKALYLACGSFVIFSILLIVRGRRQFNGQVFWTFAVLQGLMFLVAEVAGLVAGAVSPDSLLSTPMVVLGSVVLTGLTMLVYLKRKSRRAS